MRLASYGPKESHLYHFERSSFLPQKCNEHSKMATEASACHGNPNFAVICSFLQQHGGLLGVEEIAFDDLEHYLEDTKRGNSIVVSNNWNQ